jgi:L-arabinose isomerase
MFAVDERENTVLAGHAGMMDVRLAAGPDGVVLEPDGEYAESEPDSAWMSFQAKPGRVTLLCLFQDVERWKFIITSGEALAGPQKLLGSPSAYVRLDTPLPEFFTCCLQTGMTQHWALVHAEVTEELAALVAMLGAESISV